MMNRRSAIRLVLGAGLAAPAVLPALALRRRASLRIAAFAPEQINLHWQNQNQANFERLPALHAYLIELGHRPLALMNAGIYERSTVGHFQPQGLHVEGGQELRPLNLRAAPNANFYLKPNGVFYIDEEGAHVVRTPEFVAHEGIRLATQSGPLLFDAQGIHRAFIEGSDSRKRRNAVGVREDGQVVFAMAEIPTNFWDFAHVLRDEHGCKAALYMDGVISSMWLAEDGDVPPRSRQAFAGMLSAIALPEAA